MMDEDEQPARRVETIQIVKDLNKTASRQMAESVLEPTHRAAAMAVTIGAQQFGGGDAVPDINDAVAVLNDRAAQARVGDLSAVSDTLSAQIVALDTLFTELCRRAALNFGANQSAAESYMRMALKAQAQGRASIEALAKMHQPREQTVRHVTVHEGGQAVVADQFHHHAGGSRNAEVADQCQAAGTAGICAALPGAHALGPSMPIAGGRGKETVPHARRDQSRRSGRKSKRVQARSAIGGDGEA